MANKIAVPATFKELMELVIPVYKTESTFENLKDVQALLVENKEAVVKLISTQTKDQLLRFAGYRKSETKAYFVRSTYTAFCTHLVYGEGVCYSPLEESYEDAVKRYYAAQTAQSFEAYKVGVAARAAERAKALDNPETFEEYTTFVQNKGVAALSTDQKIIYDKMVADRVIEGEKHNTARTAVAQAVEVNSEMELKQTVHTKKKIDLWVVVMKDRVTREVYQALNARAKKLNGYYSSYNKDGAIAGFIFENEAEAVAFMDTDKAAKPVAEVQAAAEETKIDSRYQQLKEKAEKIIEAAQADLDRPRQANTHRRAAMASNAEQSATKKLAFGRTMLAIAEGLKDSSVKYLSAITTATELELLDNILYGAKQKHIKAVPLGHGKGYELTHETAVYAEVPYPFVYKQNYQAVLEKIVSSTNFAGKIRIAKNLLASCKRTTEEYFYIKNGLADFISVFAGADKDRNGWEYKSYAESVANWKRLERLGLTNPAVLRTAIREYISIKTGVHVPAEQTKKQKLRELERKFIGVRIEGFFPTPDELAEQVVELAEIEAGHTVLEPSAGLGHIAEVIREKHPDAKLHCIEWVHSLSDALAEKDFDVENGNFLVHQQKYDRIVMNPPFEQLQDIDHVMHAFSLLKEGGKLVAIMAMKPEGDSRYQKVASFWQVVAQRGYKIDNPAGSFKSAFRPTGVSTMTIVLTK